MSADLEEQKKAILPFMQRAQEVQQADSKVAYYCRMYGVEQALKFTQRAKEINALLGAALSQLEKDKAKLDLDPVGDRIHCLGFALRIFDNADRVDRAGKATERTSKAFYAASVFIEILNHFEAGVDAELLEKQRYCAWRAAEIRKALREGRQPLPPPMAAPPPAAAAGAASSSSSLQDLPPASGSSDWAYGRSSQAPPGPTPSGGGDSFSMGSTPGANGYPAAPSPPSPYYHTPPPPAAAAPSFSSTSATPPPAAATGRPLDGQGQAVGDGARYWPGAKMMIWVDEGLIDEPGGGGGGQARAGTVGQVIRRPDGGFSYKVALSDRVVDVPDEAAVPALEEGGYASLRPPGPVGLGAAPPQVPVTVRVLMVNDASWPPEYLVQGPNGKEMSITAHQLGPPPREATPVAAPPSAPPPQASAAELGYMMPPVSDPSLPAAAPPHGYPHGASRPSQAKAPTGPPPPPPPPPSAPAPTTASTPYPTVSDGGAYAAPTAPPPPRQPPSYAHSYSGPVPSQGWGAAGPAAAPVPAPTLSPGFKPSLQAITDAQKQAKYAISALSFEDIPTAVKNLTEALRLLTCPGPVQPHHR